MSDNDRNPDNQPTPAADPGSPVPTTPVAAAAPTTSVPAATAATPPRRGRRTALFAGGAVVAAALLVGGGAAIGAAVADDDDDDDREAGLVSDERRDAPGESSNGAAATQPYGAASVDELERVADAARGAADGSVVSIDADRDGTWDVQLVAADGSESEVRVAADGTATVRETEAAEAGDAAARNVLDAATLRSMVEAALAEADGRIVDIDADDDARSPFDVSVLTADRGIVEVTLDVDGSVLRTETDD